ITWSADYVCVSDPDEETMSFDGFVRVTNNSGEDYSDAQIRAEPAYHLVVHQGHNAKQNSVTLAAED
ncbi:MAG: hypothetical protein GY842_13485, partial [bacterium]|nr:hypothetical protein [bacterium]